MSGEPGKEELEAAYAEAGNIADAARSLGIPRARFRQLLDRHGIPLNVPGHGYVREVTRQELWEALQRTPTDTEAARYLEVGMGTLLKLKVKYGTWPADEEEYEVTQDDLAHPHWDFLDRPIYEVCQDIGRYGKKLSI